MNVWLLLGLAIAAEVAGTVALRASDGLTRVVPDALALVAYVLSFVFLALTLRHLALGTTYAIWSGVGTIAIAAIGSRVYHDVLSTTTVVGIAVVVAGVVLVNVGGMGR